MRKAPPAPGLKRLPLEARRIFLVRRGTGAPGPCFAYRLSAYCFAPPTEGGRPRPGQDAKFGRAFSFLDRFLEMARRGDGAGAAGSPGASLRSPQPFLL